MLDASIYQNVGKGTNFTQALSDAYTNAANLQYEKKREQTNSPT